MYLIIRSPDGKSDWRQQYQRRDILQGGRPHVYYPQNFVPPMYPPEQYRDRFPAGEWRTPDRDYRYDRRQQ